MSKWSSSVKLVDKSSVLVDNTGLKLEGLDEKAAVDQRVFFPFELPVQIPVQLLLELEPNWLDQNVNELEFELSRMQMKQTIT